MPRPFKEFEFDIYATTTERYEVVVTPRDADGEVIDEPVDDWAFEFVGKTDLNLSDNMANLYLSKAAGDIEITDSATRTLLITIPPAKYKRLRPGQRVPVLCTLRGIRPVSGDDEEYALVSGTLYVTMPAARA